MRRWTMGSGVLTLLLLFGLSEIGLAQEEPKGLHGAITSLEPTEGVRSLHDTHGNSVMTFDQGGGLSFYTSRDQFGTTTAQGFMYTEDGPPPLERLPSLQVPIDGTATGDADIEDYLRSRSR